MKILAEIRQGAVFFLFTLFTCCLLFATAAAQPKVVPTPESLKKSVKIISLEKAPYSSLIVQASYFAGVDAVLDLTLFYERPGKVALCMQDHVDGTPLFMIAQGNGLLYNPLEDRVNLLYNIGTLFKVGLKDNEFILIAAARYRETSSGPELRNTVVLDLPSIVKRVTVGLKSRKAKGGYLLSGYTPKGSFCQILVDPLSCPAIKRMDMYPKGESSPLFSFSRIAAGLYINRKNFEFPLKGIRDSGLKVQEIKITPVLADLFTQVSKAIFVRSALRHPELRSGVSQMGLGSLDWDEIEKIDKKNTPILRELFKEHGL